MPCITGIFCSANFGYESELKKTDAEIGEQENSVPSVRPSSFERTSAVLSDISLLTLILLFFSLDRGTTLGNLPSASFSRVRFPFAVFFSFLSCTPAHRATFHI